MQRPKPSTACERITSLPKGTIPIARANVVRSGVPPMTRPPASLQHPRTGYCARPWPDAAVLNGSLGSLDMHLRP
jgi:hypothetical protein